MSTLKTEGDINITPLRKEWDRNHSPETKEWLLEDERCFFASILVNTMFWM